MGELRDRNIRIQIVLSSRGSIKDGGEKRRRGKKTGRERKEGIGEAYEFICADP